MRTFRPLAAWLLCAPLCLAFQDPTFVRDAEGWLRVENGISYRVNPDVVTLRLAPGETDLEAFLVQSAADDARLAGLGVIRENRLGIVDLALPSGADPLEVVEALRATGRVDFAEETHFGTYDGGVPPNDPMFGQLWHLENVGQSGGTPGADVNAIDGWALETGDPSIVVAVLDSGTDIDHVDLIGNMWKNAGEIPNNGADDDGNGFVDDYDGWNFDSGNNNPNGIFNHGTMVAGVVGAMGNNGIGIVGLAGGADGSSGVSVMPVNVGSFAPNAAILDEAILYAADNGAHIITMSLTVPQSAAIDAALEYAYDTVGVFIDCAAGNNGFGVSYPAIDAHVMAVASTNRFDVKSGFSNAGPEVEVSAPGEDLTMLDIGDGYTSNSGTSFSAPHVAALAGLLLSANPALTHDQIRQVICATAKDISTPGFDTGTGWGRIDTEQAVAGALGGIGTIADVEVYGAGLAGTGGIVPLIGSGGGDPEFGNGAFRVTVRGGAPNADAVLVVGFAEGSLPFKGGTLLVDTAGFLTLGQVTDGQGTAAQPLPIPDDAGLEGLLVYTQWVVDDDGAPAGLSLSAGLELTIGF